MNSIIERMKSILEATGGGGMGGGMGATMSSNVGSYPVPLGGILVRFPDITGANLRKKKKSKLLDQY